MKPDTYKGAPLEYRYRICWRKVNSLLPSESGEPSFVNRKAADALVAKLNTNHPQWLHWVEAV